MCGCCKKICNVIYYCYSCRVCKFIHQPISLFPQLLTFARISQLECSCRFADALCSSENLDASVFPCTLNLLPADIAMPGYTKGSRTSRWEYSTVSVYILHVVFPVKFHAYCSPFLQAAVYYNFNSVLVVWLFLRKVTPYSWQPCVSVATTSIQWVF